MAQKSMTIWGRTFFGTRANIEAFSDAFMNSAFSFEGAKGFMKYRKKNMNSKQIEYYNSIVR